MCLFSWLTEYSSNILYIDFRIDLDQIKFHFEFFNLEFSVNIPLPFGCFVKNRDQQNISYKSFEITSSQVLTMYQQERMRCMSYQC